MRKPSNYAASWPRASPPRLTHPELFRPHAVREAAVATAAAGAAGAAVKGNEGEEPLEAMMDRMLAEVRLPALSKKGLFGRGQRGLHGPPRRAIGAPTCSARINRVRCRTALQVYALLDPLNAGYVNIETACERIAAVRRERKELGELLLRIVEDVMPLALPGGIIPKNMFLKALRESIEADMGGVSPYYSLRVASNPISAAYREGLPCTNVADRDFYKGTYIPQGLNATLGCLYPQRPSEAVGRKAMHKEAAPHSGQRIRATVAGDLESHIQNSRRRRERKIAEVQKEQRRKDMEECTFKPRTISMPSFDAPFPSRRALAPESALRQQHEKKEECRWVREYDLEPLQHEVALPPEGPPMSEGPPKGPPRSSPEGLFMGPSDGPFAANGREGEMVKTTDGESSGDWNKKETGEEKNEDKEKEKERKHQKEQIKRKHLLAELHPPTSYSFWVYHQGNPSVGSMDFNETLRLASLPSVPLDGLSPESPPKRSIQSKNKAAFRSPEMKMMFCSSSFEGPLYGAMGVPYTVEEREECLLFPHLNDYEKRNKNMKYVTAPPLTPGLPQTFKKGFYRERRSESSEEKQQRNIIRFGCQKAAEPIVLPVIPAAAVSERNVLNKSNIKKDDDDKKQEPLLWDTDVTDFNKGLARPRKAQQQPPRSSQIYKEKKDDNL